MREGSFAAQVALAEMGAQPVEAPVLPGQAVLNLLMEQLQVLHTDGRYRTLQAQCQEGILDKAGFDACVLELLEIKQAEGAFDVLAPSLD